jgi:hypothetical protein
MPGPSFSPISFYLPDRSPCYPPRNRIGVIRFAFWLPVRSDCTPNRLRLNGALRAFSIEAAVGRQDVSAPRVEINTRKRFPSRPSKPDLSSANGLSTVLFILSRLVQVLRIARVRLQSSHRSRANLGRIADPQLVPEFRHHALEPLCVTGSFDADQRRLRQLGVKRSRLGSFPGCLGCTTQVYRR